MRSHREPGPASRSSRKRTSTPAPKIPRDSDPSPLVYKKRQDIYTKNALFPENNMIHSEVMKMRGVDVIIVSLSPFRWNPVTKDLHIVTSCEVKVTFQGGTRHFGENRLRSRFFEPILQQHLLNYGSLPTVDFDTRQRSRNGEYEYVIIIPDDPDFLTWANVIKDFRNAQGISTGVVSLTVTGSSATEIEAYIDNIYNTWVNPPVAVLLLSDYPDSGKSYGITSPLYTGSYDTYISDNVYADVDSDELPDIVFARITAQDATDLEVMINKFIDYETSPITERDFYDKPIVAGGWQTERWFILCTEVVEGFWENVLGKVPIREYAIYSGTPGSAWSTATNTSTVVEYFGPNGLQYIPATPAHLTDW
ncbi:C25 family cysteine peptidase, partial [candidate division CSSED10-310 bacterium]